MNLRDLMTRLDTIAEAVDPERAEAYERAKTQMQRLEQAAQYTGTDEIVRRRAGLPPPLPPIEQWDGTMPKPIGKPDWFNRVLGTGGGETKDVVKDQDIASKRNAADETSFAINSANLKLLNTLVGKLETSKHIEKQVPVANAGDAVKTDTKSVAPTPASAQTDDDGNTLVTTASGATSVLGPDGKPMADGGRVNPRTWPNTDAEIKAFQKSNGLVPDGMIGKRTLAALTSAGYKAPAGFTPVPDRAMKEGLEINIAGQLIESFGYETVQEGDGADLAALGAGGVAGHLAGKALAKQGARFIPGVATGIDAVDAYQRIRDKDYIGAGIAGAGAVGGLLPGIGGVLSGGAAGINLGRDIAKHYNNEEMAKLRTMQKELGIADDGKMGPATLSALKANPKIAAKYGFDTSGKPVKKESTVAESMADIRDKLSLLEYPVSPFLKGGKEVVDVIPRMIRRPEKFMGQADVVAPKVIGTTPKIVPRVPTAPSNIGKKTLGAAALGAGGGYLATRDGGTQSTKPPSSGGTQSTKPPEATPTTEPTPTQATRTEYELSPEQLELIKQIQEVMSKLADVEDPRIQTSLGNAQSTIEKIQQGPLGK